MGHYDALISSHLLGAVPPLHATMSAQGDVTLQVGPFERLMPWSSYSGLEKHRVDRVTQNPSWGWPDYLSVCHGKDVHNPLT